MARPRILVFQHIDIEHPGIFRDFLADDGVEWRAVELDDGEPIPDLERFDALWVMGGPMDTWQEDDYPWLGEEKAAIRRAIGELAMPFLGFCLGHQLLADALGGEVGPAEVPEVGIMDVELTTAGSASPFLAELPQVMKCLQWHSAEVRRPPAAAECLVRSADCAVQAMSIGRQAFSIQYHVELTADTVREWGAVPAYGSALEATLGAGALERFDAEAAANLADFNHYSRTLYRNWMNTVFNGMDGDGR